MLEIILAIAAGIISGTISGLTPGLHINLTSILAITLPINPFFVTLFILSMAITHTFTDTIPSIYLGAPDESMALAALPGHKLLLEGNGHKAILLTIIGSLGALIASIIALPVFYFVIEKTYPIIKPYTAYILIAVLLTLLLKEKSTMVFTIFLTSGILGAITFSLPLNQPLLPLFSGFFGISLLLLSSKNTIPKQDTNPQIEVTTKPIILATIAGFIAAFLPGIGSSQMAIIAQKFVQKSNEAFLILVGGINTAGMLISIITLLAINKARNGAIVAIEQIFQITANYLYIFVPAVLIAGAIATILTMYLSKWAATTISRLPVKLLERIIIIVIFLSTFLFDHFWGVIILVTATSLGIITQLTNVPKHYLLGSLLIPTILYLL